MSDQGRPFLERARELLDQFATGWGRSRPDLMLELFRGDAVFRETPFTAPINGIDEIRKWAADIPYHQSEIRFTLGEVMVAPPWCSAEFRLVFRRRKTGDWVDARGAMFVETDGELITELRMYWHRVNKGRDEAPV